MASFWEAIRNKDFVITVEPPLHTQLTRDALSNSFDALADRVDGVQLSDDEQAEPHIAPLASASIALSRGVDPVVHLSARDRNRIALHGEILGAAAIGVTSLVLKRGNKLPPSLKGRVKSVFDSRTVQLLQLAARIGETAPIVAPPGLLLGAMVTAITPPPGWQAERLGDKLDAGAGFLQSRNCLDVELLKHYAAALVALKLTHRATFIVSVPLLTSVAGPALADRGPSGLCDSAGICRNSCCMRTMRGSRALHTASLASRRCATCLACRASTSAIAVMLRMSSRFCDARASSPPGLATETARSPGRELRCEHPSRSSQRTLSGRTRGRTR